MLIDYCWLPGPETLCCGLNSISCSTVQWLKTFFVWLMHEVAPRNLLWSLVFFCFFSSRLNFGCLPTSQLGSYCRVTTLLLLYILVCVCVYFFLCFLLAVFFTLQFFNTFHAASGLHFFRCLKITSSIEFHSASQPNTFQIKFLLRFLLPAGPDATSTFNWLIHVMEFKPISRK